MSTKIGRFLTQFFIGVLPWSVVISVFFSERLGIDSVRFFKEGLIALIALFFIFDSFKKKVRPHFDTLDFLIIGYILTLAIVSSVEHTPLKGIVYGLRYDAGFLLVFMVLRRAIALWGRDISFENLAKIFLISGGLMLAASFVIRYIFGEMILTELGFSPYVSQWDAGGAPPIYHGIPGASVIRFQGMLEGPNQMAFFLIIYIATYLTVMWRKRPYRFINSIVVLLLLYLMMQTYSRSGYLGVGAGMGVLAVWYLVERFRTRKFYTWRAFSWKKLFLLLVVGCGIAFMLMFQFGHKFAAIFERHGSTSGHFERMYIGYLRFLEQPLGHGLASAGPASRSVAEINQNPIPISALNPEMSYLNAVFLKRNPDFVFSTEHYYIPESWYIQQMIEGGIIGAAFFALVLLMLLWKTRSNRYMFCACLGVFIMNIFLHSFESVHSSFVLFTLLAGTMPVSDTHFSKKY